MIRTFVLIILPLVTDGPQPQMHLLAYRVGAILGPRFHSGWDRQAVENDQKTTQNDQDERQKNKIDIGVDSCVRTAFPTMG